MRVRRASAMILVMPLELNCLVAGSMAALILLGVLWARKGHRWRSFWAGFVALAVFAVFLNRLLAFPFAPAVAKGSQDLTLAVALYVCMLGGMLAQYIYRRFEKPSGERAAWDWGLFVAPAFASPIVFIPLLAAFQAAEVKLDELTAPRLMIFFVAFQNGFFWKDFFERKQKESATK